MVWLQPPYVRTSKNIGGVDHPQPARTVFQGVGNPQPAAAVDNPEPANEACLWHCPSSLNEATACTYAAHASETCSIPRAGTKNNITKHTILYNRSSHSAGPIIDALAAQSSATALDHWPNRRNRHVSNSGDLKGPVWCFHVTSSFASCLRGCAGSSAGPVESNGNPNLQWSNGTGRLGDQHTHPSETRSPTQSKSSNERENKNEDKYHPTNKNET